MLNETINIDSMILDLTPYVESLEIIRKSELNQARLVKILKWLKQKIMIITKKLFIII